MPKVLLISSSDLSPELGDTAIFAKNIDRVSAPPPEALEVARRQRPSLVVLDGDDALTVLPLVRQLRSDPLARNTSIAVLSRSASLVDEEAFREAGANLVLGGAVDPFLWNRRLEVLMFVPPRRETRFPMTLDQWTRFAPETDPVAAWALNISVRGVLVETSDPVDVGTKVELRFTLPRDSDEMRAVGHVVREAGAMGDLSRAGVEFLILFGQARERIAWFVDRSGEA